MSALIEVRSLRKSYPAGRSALGRVRNSNVVVDEVSFDIANGETLAIVGESGAGKSTVGRLVLRLIEADSGSITFDGTDVRAMSKHELRRRRPLMQMIFQDPYSSLNPKMTIGDSVAEPLLLHSRLTRDERRSKVRELLVRVGIRPDQVTRYPSEMSGGQLQRVSIARALAPGSKFLVCDEPVAALDMSIQAQVLNLLRDLQEDGLSYLFISHDLSLVSAIAHRVAVMYQGRIVEIGSNEQLFSNPQHPYTRRLLSAIAEPNPHRRKLHKLPPVAPRDDHDRSWNGCAFYWRCPVAEPACKVETPLLREREPGHEVACHVVPPPSHRMENHDRRS